MSHLTIQRKRTQSIRPKLYSQQSKNIAPRHSVGRILNDSISKRRRTTHNSPDQSQEVQVMNSEIEHAKQLYRNKDTKNALIQFRKLYKKYPNNCQVSYFIGSCYLNQGNFDYALINFKNCLLLNQNFNKNIFICIAICYKAQNKFKQAINILNTACQKHPKFKDAYFYKGKIQMKSSLFNDALISFKKCLKIEPNNQLCLLFLADCQKNTGQFKDALQNYDHIIKQSPQYFERAFIKKIGLLLEYKKIKQAQKQIRKAGNHKIQSPELNFLKGQCEYQLGNYNDAITFFQLCLTSNLSQFHISRSLKFLIQISIKQKDFFGAEHLISRSKFTNVNQEDLILYYKLVQGINDLIKKRLTDCEQKLKCVHSSSLNQRTDSQKFLYGTSSPYYAYCLFSIQNYQKSLEVYRKFVQNNNCINKLDEYNTLICQGIVFHKNNKFGLAQEKFLEALKKIGKKIQPIFLICVNTIQQNKELLNQKNCKQQILCKLEKQFKLAHQMNCITPLFLFYQSLVYLFQGKDACQIIDRAISLSQEQVSQYYFIQALAYSLAGQNLKGLESITKAIQLDHNIPQFFKERSKYYYVLQRYDEALSDILKILSDTNDEQAKLLLTFYYYMTGDYNLSLEILIDVSEHCSQQKFKQFQTALYFRLHKYDKCGVIGTIIGSIIQKKTLNLQFLETFNQQYIGQRQIYSQFTVHHFHLFLSAYYFYNNEFDNCLEHLFGALEQIQINSESDDYISLLNQKIINQIKFNIIITSLQKQCSQKASEQKLQLKDTCKYIEMFINQTEDMEFKLNMKQFLAVLMSEQKNKQRKSVTEISELFQKQSKISDDLPQVEIKINKSQSIKVKFLLIYPQKLKFNITPEFDQSFLSNFDIDKVQSKLYPPWFKLHEGQLFFTDKIRNQSVIISETEKNPTPSLIIAPSPVIPQSLRQKFKLDDAVEKKLEKLMKKRKNNQQQEKLKNYKSKSRIMEV